MLTQICLRRRVAGNSGHSQKPSSARPIQLTAKIEQAIAATDARVAMVFVGTMTKSPFRQSQDSVQRLLLNHGDNLLRLIIRLAVAALPHRADACLQKPAFAAPSEANRWGIWGMYRLPNGGVEKHLVAFVALALFALVALVALWLGFYGSSPQLARDFEECIEQAEATPSTGDARGAPMTGCNARFAGRRKPGGGYSYYDFMQDRNFDIAGPNPTAQEREQIDQAYMGFLDAQRREAVSAELARRQNEQLRADLERARQPVKSPMALTPANVPLPTPRPQAKSARCESASLSCGWEKFSAIVKNAFASSSRTKP
jgi:hypothetical protein